MPLDLIETLIGQKSFKDQVTFQTKPKVPDRSFGGSAFDPSDPIPADGSRMRRRLQFSQDNVAATTQTKAIGIIWGTTAKIVGLMVSNSARAIGAATVTVNLRKNGVTVLTGVYTLDNAHPAAGAGFASIDISANLDPAQVDCVKGDVIDVVLTAAAGGGTLPTEVQVEAIVDEDPA